MNILVWLTHPDVPCWNFDTTHARRVESELPGCRVRRATTADEFLDGLADCRVAIVWTFREEWLERAPQLEWIVTPAAGRDYFRVVPLATRTVSLLVQPRAGYYITDPSIITIKAK